MLQNFEIKFSYRSIRECKKNSYLHFPIRDTLLGQLQQGFHAKKKRLQ